MTDPSEAPVDGGDDTRRRRPRSKLGAYASWPIALHAMPSPIASTTTPEPIGTKRAAVASLGPRPAMRVPSHRCARVVADCQAAQDDGHAHPERHDQASPKTRRPVVTAASRTMSADALGTRPPATPSIATLRTVNDGAAERGAACE